MFGSKLENPGICQLAGNFHVFFIYMEDFGIC